MTRPKAISLAECDYKGALRLTFRDRVVDQDCTRLINRTWQAADGCGNVVYLIQVIRIRRPRLLVSYPPDVPEGCLGAISLAVTGRPVVEGPCKKERVRVTFRDNISKKDCQEKALFIERHFTVTDVCGREYGGIQRIFPGESTTRNCMAEKGETAWQEGETAWQEGESAWREGRVSKSYPLYLYSNLLIHNV